MKRDLLNIRISPQPTDSACGPTCLHAIYQYFGDTISLGEVIDGVKTLEGGGTIAAQMAVHALKRGYKAKIYSYNMAVFDPTWYQLPPEEMMKKLAAQKEAKNDPKLSAVTDTYLEFYALGGRVNFADLTPALIRGYVKRGVPLLAGLSATFLYSAKRERKDEANTEDDVAGYPAGHFVVIYGYNSGQGMVSVADPLRHNPAELGQRYEVNLYHLVCSILLGILTYDSNILVIEP